MKFLYASLVLSVMACASQKTVDQNTIQPTTVQNSKDYTLQVKLGQSITTQEHTIRFAQVSTDSRCPEGTQCIWAGEISTHIEIEDNHQHITKLPLTFSPKAVNVNNPQLLVEDNTWMYYATNILPYPKDGELIATVDYVLEVLKVSK